MLGSAPGSVQAVRSHRTAVEISTTKVSRGNHGLTLTAVSDQCSDSSDTLMFVFSIWFSKFSCSFMHFIHLQFIHTFKFYMLLYMYVFMFVIFDRFNFTILISSMPGQARAAKDIASEAGAQLHDHGCYHVQLCLTDGKRIEQLARRKGSKREKASGHPNYQNWKMLKRFFFHYAV